MEAATDESVPLSGDAFVSVPSCDAQLVVELLHDLALDRALQRAHEEAELGVDADFLLGDGDAAVDAGARELERVAVPAMGDPVFLADRLGNALDRGLGVLDAAVVPTPDVNDGHG